MSVKLFNSAVLICYCLAASAPSIAGENSLILVYNTNTGSLDAQRPSSSFILKYGPGGVLSDIPLQDRRAAKQSIPFVPKRQHNDHIFSAIDQVALRYARHDGLRKANLAVTEWLALFRANIEIESGYDENAVSRTGAIGLGQLMPQTASHLGVDPHNTAQNLDGSARYMLMLLHRFGDKELALAGYNAGPEAVEKYGGIPPYQETRDHVKKVMSVFLKLSNPIVEKGI